MRHYECECLSCGSKRQIAFRKEPYPEYGEEFPVLCPICGREAQYTRALTKKTAAELRRHEAEQQLRDIITDKCGMHGFSVRFLYQSVIITTPLADWCFDYHQKKITLYHESTRKINFKTGDYAKAHIQFSGRKMTPTEVVDYIAKHDAWRAEKNKQR